MAMDEQPASILERKLEWESVANKPVPEIPDPVSEPAKPKAAAPAEPAPAVQAAYQPPYTPPAPLNGWYGQLRDMIKNG
jgi:hypothetical protein